MEKKKRLSFNNYLKCISLLAELESVFRCLRMNNIPHLVSFSDVRINPTKNEHNALLQAGDSEFHD